MKRILTVFLMMILALGMTAAAEYGMCDVDYAGDMIVVNCDEWISLRSAPDTDAARVAKVPLGATLTDCIISNENTAFMYGCYNGQWGYALREYLTTVGTAMPAFEEVYVGDMTVVDCDEWVSLRNAPSSASPRILKVPLGAKVTDCLIVSDEFAYCWYNGYSGYIMTKYLSANAAPAAGMSRSALMNFGSEALNVSYNGYTVMSRRGYQDGGEILKTVCYGPDGSPVWHYDTLTENATELDMTAAFPGGTAQTPMIMVYNAEAGLTALDLYTGAQQWFLSRWDADLGGSISTATDGLGNMYIGGFYGPDPVAIDMYGTILWRAQPSIEAYWMHEIILTEAGVTAVYDCLGEHEQGGEICYDYGTGEEVGKQWY